jgi:hypothetical protein
MCTTEYRILTISIIDSSARPLILTNYFVRKTSTGEVIEFSKEEPYADSVNKINGIYILFTDGKMAMTSKSGTEFEFHGIKGDIEIVNEKYIIGNDLCHVQRISGKPVITP